MKKIKYLLFLLILIPFNVNAIYFDVKDDIKDDNYINESVIRVGNDVDVKNKVNGINFVLGNNAKINGESEHLITLGNNINISGAINNDSFILGNIVKISDFKNKRDIVILGNEVEINGDVIGNLNIFANKVTIKGNYRNVYVKANNIVIEGKISDKLEYNEDANITSNNAEIKEMVKTEKLNKEIDLNTKVLSFITNYGGTLFIFLALCFITPQLFKRVMEKNKDLTLLNVFSFFGFGTLSVILIPVVFILLVSLIFGIQMAFLLLVFYFIALYLSSIFTGFLLGNIIWNKFIKKEKNVLLVGLLGISIIKILTIVPGLGQIILSVSMMIGMGIILQQFKRD